MKNLTPIQGIIPSGYKPLETPTTRTPYALYGSLGDTNAERRVPPVKGQWLGRQQTSTSSNWLSDEESKFDVDALTEAGLWPEYQQALRALGQTKQWMGRPRTKNLSAWNPQQLAAFADTARKFKYADGTAPQWLAELDDILSYNQRQWERIQAYRGRAQHTNQDGSPSGQDGRLTYSERRALKARPVAQPTTQPAPQPILPLPASPTSIAGAYRRGLLNGV